MRKTKLLAIAMAAVVGMSSVPAVYRDVVVAQADETTGETFSLDEPNYLAAYTAGKKVTTDKQTLNFTFKTYETATLNWDTPVLLVYTSDDGIYESKNTNYKHYANVRSDCWVDAEGTTETDASKNITINKTYPSDFAKWLEACKKEGKATVEYQKDSSNKVTIKYTVVAGDYTSVSEFSFIADEGKETYFAVTGELCTISGLPIDMKMELSNEQTRLKSVAGTYSDTDKTTTFGQVKCDGWWTNWSNGVEITEDAQKFSFKTTTNESVDFRWDTPATLVFTSVDGGLYKPTTSKNLYKEYSVIRSDCYVITGKETVNETSGSLKTTGVPTVETKAYPDGANEDEKKAIDDENNTKITEAWKPWVDANKKGTEVTGTVKREGNNVILTYLNNGIGYTATIPVEEGKKAYLSLTGEQCTIDNLKFEPAPAEATPTPGTDATPAPGTSATPAPGTSATPAPGTSATPAPGTSATQAPGTSATPAPGTNATPALGTSAKPAPGTSATPAPGTSAKPAPGTSTEPAAKPSATPTAKPTVAPTKKPSNTKKPAKKLKSATITVKNGKKKVSSVTVKTKKSVKLAVSVNSKAKLSVAKLSKKNAKVAKVTFKKNKLTIKGLKKGKVSIKITSKKTSKYKAATKTIKVTVKK